MECPHIPRIVHYMFFQLSATRVNSKPKLQPDFGRCPRWFIFFKNLFYQIQRCPLKFFIGKKSFLCLGRTLPSISKITPGYLWYNMKNQIKLLLQFSINSRYFASAFRALLTTSFSLYPFISFVYGTVLDTVLLFHITNPGGLCSKPLPPAPAPLNNISSACKVNGSIMSIVLSFHHFYLQNSYCKWLIHVLISQFSLKFLVYVISLNKKTLTHSELETKWVEDVFIVKNNKKSSSIITSPYFMLTHTGNQA